MMKKEYMKPDAEWIRYEYDVIKTSEEIEYGEQEFPTKSAGQWGGNKGF